MSSQLLAADTNARNNVNAFLLIVPFLFFVIAGPYSLVVGNEALDCQKKNNNQHCKKYMYYFWGYYVAGGIGIIIYAILLIILFMNLPYLLSKSK